MKNYHTDHMMMLLTPYCVWLLFYGKIMKSMELEKQWKVVTFASTLYGQHIGCQRYIKDKGWRVDIDQQNSIANYNKTMGGADRMSQNISYYMISIRTKK